MKKLLTIILISALAISSAACSSGSKEGGSTNETTVAETTTGKAELDKEKLDSTIKEHKFKGIVYITKDGKTIYESVTGKNENGDALKIDSPMFIGSVSKQFCAAGIMLLSEQGKLSVDDKLEKYYPEYKIGKDITLKNLLSMRSGILDMVNQAKVDGISEDKTDEENTKIIMNWIFKQELQEKPDTHYKYSNTNYFLLSNIIEKLTGQKYIDFMRKNFFEPLKMDGTGSLDEISDSPKWAKEICVKESVESVKGLTKGAGDIVSTAPDMEKWMTGLSHGKVISEKSYGEMTKDYSPEDGANYGFGLQQEYAGGAGHSGMIATYVAHDYINKDKGINLYAVTNKRFGEIDGLPSLLLSDIIEG